MPTKTPRLNVTLSPEVRAALERLSVVSGIAASQFVAQVMQDSLPVLEAMIAAFEAAKRSPRQAADLMRGVVSGAMASAAQEQLRFDAHVREPRLRKRPRKNDR